VTSDPRSAAIERAKIRKAASGSIQTHAGNIQAWREFVPRWRDPSPDTIPSGLLFAMNGLLTPVARASLLNICFSV
jgi:hypothetical protein